MFCTNCGKEISENAAFCSYCGSPVNKSNSIPVNINSIPVPGFQEESNEKLKNIITKYQKKEKSKFLTCTFLGIISGFIGLYVFQNYGTSYHIKSYTALTIFLCYIFSSAIYYYVSRHCFQKGLKTFGTFYIILMIFAVHISFAFLLGALFYYPRAVFRFITFRPLIDDFTVEHDYYDDLID